MIQIKHMLIHIYQDVAGSTSAPGHSILVSQILVLLLSPVQLAPVPTGSGRSHLAVKWGGCHREELNLVAQQQGPRPAAAVTITTNTKNSNHLSKKSISISSSSNTRNSTPSSVSPPGLLHLASLAGHAAGSGLDPAAPASVNCE